MPRVCLLVVFAFSFVSTVKAAAPAGEKSLPELPAEPVARIRIAPDRIERPVSPTFIGINLHPGGPRPKLLGDMIVQRRVRSMGISTLRFPNGCAADRYNWKQPNEGWVTVDEFLDFCEAVDAEAYYTLNMQGGSEGLEGPIPENPELGERIRYRHTAPNPCGDTRYHFGTLPEALELLQKHTIERALAGKRPILHYELGNENWGQATTDWPPLVYGRTCEVYAAAFRKVLEQAKQNHPELAELRLYIVAVGYPTMGNNQDPFKATNREINVAWTSEMNRLAKLGLVDAVQEHFYPYGNADGSTLLWTVHNLSNILHLRYGVPNPRLGGYQDPELAYRLPMEWTEWNVKCWGPQPKTDIPLANGGFESGSKGWTVEAEPPASATVRATRRAVRRGARGMEVSAGSDSKRVELRQSFSIAHQKTTAGTGAAVWVKTSRPDQTFVMVRQANDGPNKGAELGTVSPTQPNMWERVIASGAPKEDTKEVEIVLAVRGSGVVVFFDEVQPIHWSTFSGIAPLVATRFEQQLFIVDALRTLLEWPTPRTHLHHLFGNYPCPTLSIDGIDRENAVPFRFLKGRIGDRVVKTHCEVPTLSYHTNADAWASDFNALAPDMSDVPALSALTTRDERRLYVLLVNRTSDRTIQTEISFEGAALGSRGDVRTLTGVDFDVVGANVRTSALAVSEPLKHAVPPHSAQVLRVDLEN